MDKNAIRKFAVWARRELIARVSQRAERFGITETTPSDPHAESVNGHLLTDTERRQRAALIARIQKNGYKAVMEEAAYTWFNRFCALRFMEVNGFLPTRIRVFTDEENGFHPQILTEAIHMELDGLDMERVYQLKSDSDDEALYKYLLITQCNALCSILPGMFTPIADYTGLLMPDNLLREGSVIEQMIALIPEADWLDQVQIIGWLYQYYNTELNELVYDGNMSKSRITKDLLPAATTIYTPDWAVRYMVENSLGRLWVEGHPDEALKAGWRYYLEEAEQEPQVQQALARIRAEYAQMKPEDIRCIDPCMGSGHILVYMFDVLLQIYQAYGYSTREAVQSILQNNLYGLDIDDRAAQLAYFAVMMKARQVDKRFFSRGIQPHVRAIVESGDMPQEAWALFGPQQDIARRVYAAFVDAKEYGSLIEPNVTLKELDTLQARLCDMDGMATYGSLSAQAVTGAALNVICPLLEQARALVQKYDVVVTNPPYLGSGRFSPSLDKYAKDCYPDEKSDLSAIMYHHAIDDFAKKNGFVAFITTTSWMYLSSFEKLRKHIAKNASISSLVDFGTELFDGKVGHNPIVSWVSRKARLNYTMTAIRLVDYCYSRRDEKEPEYFNLQNRYTAQMDNFSKIPGAPVAYWVSEALLSTFEYPKFDTYASTNNGFTTGNNDLFLRFWFEVAADNISMDTPSIDALNECSAKWFPYNKGGDFRKWYGNNDYIINYGDNGKDIKAYGHLVPRSLRYQFHQSGTWNKITSGTTAFRYKETGTMFDVGGLSFFPNNDNLIYYLLALCNSSYIRKVLEIISPTLNCETGHVSSIPVILSENKNLVDDLCKECISLSRVDWDSFETSWDFKEHPFITWSRGLWEGTNIACTMTHYYGYKPEVSCPLELCFLLWQGECNERFAKLKANEEELNRIFIDIYGLQDELTPEVEDKDVTVRRADLGRDIRSFISYAVGCMFGRYSIYKPGLMFAGEPYSARAFADKLNSQPGTVSAAELNRAYHAEGIVIDENFFYPDADGILPISDDEYFDDDIVGRFVQFVETVFGKETLEENLRFIANALGAGSPRGSSGTPRQVIRSYFLNDFYADHLKIYQKRPIYWLFDSGKKNGFKCLIYMHRYAPDTLARIRTDYVHEQQSRYRTAIADLEKRVASASTAERVKLQKQLTKVVAQADELRAYEEKIHHLADQMIAIDLDDGVKVNYAKFGDVLAKIK